jgi:hypothetical protein
MELAELLKTAVVTLGPFHELTTAIERATIHFDGDPVLAERFYRAILDERLAEHGPDHADTLRARVNLVAAIAELGRLAEAEAECRNVLADLHRLAAGDVAAMARARGLLGWSVYRAGRFVEAERELRAALAGADRSLTPGILLDLATVLLDLGRYAEAESAIRTAAVGYQRVYGTGSPRTWSARVMLAWILVEQDRGTEVSAELHDLTSQMIAWCPGDIWTLHARLALAKASRDLGMMRDVVTSFTEVRGEDDRHTLDARYELGVMLGTGEEGVAILRAVFGTRMRVLPPGHPDTGRARAALDRAGW